MSKPAIKQTRSQEVTTTEVVASLRSRCPLLWVNTGEEARIEGHLVEGARVAAYMPHFWDVADGLTGLDGKPERERPDREPPEGPDQVFAEIRRRSQQDSEDWPEGKEDRNLWIMRDLPVWLEGAGGALTLRQLVNLARPDGLPNTLQKVAQAIVVLSPNGVVPPELANHVTIINWPLPDRDEIASILDATVSTLPAKMQTEAVNGARDASIDAAVGMTGEAAQATFGRSIVTRRKVDPATIAQEKERAIRSSGLEWMKPVRGGMKAVGGLENWKQWAVSRAGAYTPAARAYGLPAPKGALLCGVPGCGKTLSAKGLAAEWGVPLIKLDLGAMKAKFVGDSEANIRGAFARLEAIGRCIVLADEIEKALAGASGEAGDGGVAADALGALLAWMNDRTSDAFVIATANDIGKLPPELLRKGRFDEIWWVDLPNEVERVGVMAAALRSHGRDADAIGIDLPVIAAATASFSGAEIAALVPDAMFAAFAEDGREITTDDLLAAAKSVKPQGSNRKRPEFARPATKADTGGGVASKPGTRQLDL